MVKSTIASILTLLFIIVIQTAVLSNILILPAVPDLLLIVTLYLSLLNGRGAGECYGFVGGLFLDFATGAPMGFGALVRTLISYVAGALGSVIQFGGVFMPCLIVFVASMAKVLLMWLVSLFFISVPKYDVFSLAFAFEVASNVVLAPIIFRLMSAFKTLLSLKDEGALDGI